MEKFSFVTKCLFCHIVFLLRTAWSNKNIKCFTQTRWDVIRLIGRIVCCTAVLSCIIVCVCVRIATWRQIRIFPYRSVHLETVNAVCFFRGRLIRKTRTLVLSSWNHQNHPQPQNILVYFTAACWKKHPVVSFDLH